MKILNNVLAEWRYLFIAPFLFLSHATTFFLHNGIPLFSLEYLASVFLILVLCAPFGILMVFGGLIIRIMTAAVLGSLFVLSMIDDPTLIVIVSWIRYIYALVALIVVISVGMYLVRQHMDKILFILFGVFLLGSFFTSESPPLKEKRFDVSGKSNDVSLPPYIHIILDEHIGIEGIPPEEDQNSELTNNIKSKYIQNGFRVYGRAYSRYTLSLNSFSSFLMLKAIDNPGKYSQGNSVTQHLKENEFFKELSKNGYHINVVQSSYLNLCDKNENLSIRRCIIYNLLAPIHLSRSDSLSIMFSSVLTTMRVNGFYDRVQETSLGKALRLPDIKKVTNQSSSEATYGAFPKVLELLRNAEMGNAYFIHLLLPHRPYKFNKECSLIRARTPPESESNYQYYLEQVVCVQSLMDQLLSKLDENSNVKNSTIVIHGDHGSRIVFPGTGSIPGGIDSTDENFIQSFSTFFAVRGPEHKVGYDRGPLALDHLLSEVVLGKEPDVDNDGIVYLQKANGSSSLIRTPLPPFSHGRPSNKW
jgi:hypothetical protein